MVRFRLQLNLLQKKIPIALILAFYQHYIGTLESIRKKLNPCPSVFLRSKILNLFSVHAWIQCCQNCSVTLAADPPITTVQVNANQREDNNNNQ